MHRRCMMQPQPIAKRFSWLRFQMIYKAYRISLHIAVFVQGLAVCDAAIYDVSVDKAFDLRIIVTGSHVIQSVCACFYTISSIIQEAELFCLQGFPDAALVCCFSCHFLTVLIINTGKLAVGSVSNPVEKVAIRICDRSCTADMVVVVVAFFCITAFGFFSAVTDKTVSVCVGYGCGFIQFCFS